MRILANRDRLSLWIVMGLGLILSGCGVTPSEPLPSAVDKIITEKAKSEPSAPIQDDTPKSPTRLEPHKSADAKIETSQLFPPSIVESLAKPVKSQISLKDLPGWEQEDVLSALFVLKTTCRTKKNNRFQKACEALTLENPQDSFSARRFFEAQFRAQPIEGEGLLTGYFAPEYEARISSDAEFSMPVRARPHDLVMVDGTKLNPTLLGRKAGARKTGDNQYQPYEGRSEIEAGGPEKGTILAWMRPEDLFFLQIQGSGYLSLPEGRRLRASYAADNGRPFVGIAKTLVQMGQMTMETASADAIRSWLSAHRGAEAQKVMATNPRYVFFQVSEDDGKDPTGAAGQPLPAGRAAAIDPLHHTYGELLWLAADAGVLTQNFSTYNRLVAALDTGGAIKGAVRADLYMGRGNIAGSEAGKIKHRLRLWQIQPVDGSDSKQTELSSVDSLFRKN